VLGKLPTATSRSATQDQGQETTRNPPPTWEDLSTPLDLDKIESQVEDLYVLPLRRLVKSLCDEIRELRRAAPITATGAERSDDA